MGLSLYFSVCLCRSVCLSLLGECTLQDLPVVPGKCRFHYCCVCPRLLPLKPWSNPQGLWMCRGPCGSCAGCSCIAAPNNACHLEGCTALQRLRTSELLDPNP